MRICKIRNIFIITLMTILSFSSEHMSSVFAKAHLNLNSKDKIESHIVKSLEKTVSMIIKPSRFILSAKVFTRGNRRRKVEQVFLGKLGTQNKQSKKSRFIKEALVRRVTKVEIDIYIHPLVSQNKTDIVKKLISSTTPFVKAKNLIVRQHKMNIYPKSLMLQEYIDHVTYWYKQNKKVIKTTSLYLFSFLFFGLFSWFFTKWTIKKWRIIEELVHKRIDDIKHLGLESPTQKNQLVIKENLDSQMKLFYSRLVTSERRALEIRKWFYLDKHGAKESLVLLPKLLGEEEFTKVYKVLPTEMQKKWQIIISSAHGPEHKELVHDFLRTRNLEGLQEEHFEKNSHIIEEMTVSLNVNELILFLEESSKYGPYLLTSLPHDMAQEVMKGLSSKAYFDIAEEGIQKKALEIKFIPSEIDEIISKVRRREEVEHASKLEFDYLLDHLNSKDEAVFFNSLIKNKTKFEMMPILRQSLPSEFIETMSLVIYQAALMEIPLAERAEYLMALEDDKRNRIVALFKSDNYKMGKIVESAINRIRNDKHLLLSGKFNKDEKVKLLNELLRSEVRKSDKSFKAIEKELEVWIMEKQVAIPKGENNVA